MTRLAIVVTHPIQYYVPVFQLLAASNGVTLKVFYSADAVVSGFDAGFQKEVEWDIPLLDGYDHQFVNNKSLVEKISSFQPAAILIYGWSPKGHLKVMRFFKGKVPVWFRGDSTLLDPLPWYKKISRYFILNWVYKHIDKAFYVGSANKEYYLEYGLTEEQLFFAPHAVDNERFGINRSAEAAILREELKIGEDSLLILFAGKFETKKAPLSLLKAFKELRMPNLHLLFTGSGTLEDDLKAGAAGSAGIHFSDFINQSAMPVFYQASDLFCLPSAGPAETWGLAVNEAMAAGKAVIVSNRVGCAIDLVDNYKNGLVYDCENSDGLKIALSELLSDKQQLKKMGVYSQQIIKEYSFANQVNTIERHLKLIVHG